MAQDMRHIADKRNAAVEMVVKGNVREYEEVEDGVGAEQRKVYGHGRSMEIAIRWPGPSNIGKARTCNSILVWIPICCRPSPFTSHPRCWPSPLDCCWSH